MGKKPLEVLVSGGFGLMGRFLGNPNVTISAIDAVTTGIVASRTSGELPAFVQVSASGITATGTSIPYEDLEYSWNFGDPSGTETFTNPVTGQTVNANSAQTGPEAAYVYRSAGTYTITLTIRGSSAAPIAGVCTQFTTATATATFTASAFSTAGGEYFFDSVNGNDSNSGTDSAHPKQTISALNTLLAAGHMRFNLARGSNWVGSNGIYIAYSDIRIAAYGSGANPIVNIQNASSSSNPGAAFNALSCDNQTRATSNIVISNVDFWRSGTSPNSIVNFLFTNTTNLVNDIYFDNVNIVSNSSTTVQSKWLRYQFPDAPTVTTNIQRMGMWGGSINIAVGDQAQDIAIYGGSRAWNFFVGISPFTGNGQPANPTLVHHIYANFHDHGLFRWINFGSGPNRNFNIKVAVNSLSGSYEVGNYWLISENNMTGTQNAHGGGNSQGADAGLSDVQNFVIEINAVHGFSQSFANTQNVLSATWRYNNIWNMDTGFVLITANSLGSLSSAELAANIKIYGNNIYRNNTGGQTSGNSAICQKIVAATGSATWDNGSGSSGTTLTVTSFSAGLGAHVVNGQIPLYVNASVPGFATISGASGSTTTGTYTLSQSFLITPTTGLQFAWGWTTHWTITDNVVMDISATPTLMDLQFTGQSGATINRNQWYCPNGHLTPGSQTGTPFFDNRFSKTFAQLQAAGFGPNDTVADPTASYPYWVNPSSGQFSNKRRLVVKT
jgi:hypothetical protein